MTTIIKDGTGSGANAKVSLVSNRLFTDSKSSTVLERYSEDGRGFFITSFKVALTSDNESCIIYIKNTSEDKLVLHQIRYQTTASTGGTGLYQTTALINPTGGTIVTGTDGVDYNTSIAFNNDLSQQASNPFDGVIRVGLEGTTATGLLPGIPSILSESGVVQFDSSFIFPKGSSGAILVTPPSGNTSCEVIVEAITYYIEED
jgi:hypothetical protein